ncbi:MAG: hypothetical protein AAF628_33355 [Planctomycetota bacterium]
MPFNPCGHGRRAALPLAFALASSLTAPVTGAAPEPAPRTVAARATTTPTAFVTRVRFANLTMQRRQQWGVATVPFPIGVWTPGKSFTVRGLQSELVPFGARWPDGSVRYAQLVVPLDLAPAEETLVEVVEGTPPRAPFVASDWLLHGLRTFDLRLAVKLPTLGWRTASLPAGRLIENGAHRKIYHSSGRIPDTDLVYDLWLSFYSGQDHVPFELRLFSSSAGSQQWQESFEAVDLWVDGAEAVVRGAPRRGVQLVTAKPGGPNFLRLLGPDSFFDGQGQEWFGDLFFEYPTGAPSDARRLATLAAVREQTLYGVSTDWAASGAFGPFGYVPPAPPWITDGGRAASLSQLQAYRSWIRSAGGPWDDMPMGMLPDPSSPGDQLDFGAAKLVQIVASGLPHNIEEARFQASEEARRPTHHREVNTAPVRSAAHPDWVSWSGRTHFSTVISPDRLGKPEPQAFVEGHGWFGRDHEHASSLTLASTYLLTRSLALRDELDNEAELYLSSHTLPSQKPGWSTSVLFPARALGRTMLSMSWNYLATGNDVLRQRLAARAREVVRPQAEGTTVAGPVRPIQLYAPDPRQLNRTHWRPWEEAQAVLGLEAAYRITGERDAHAVAVMAAKNLMNYGWLLTARETIIATAVTWELQGAALSRGKYNSSSWVLWSHQTSFSEWSIPAVKLAMRYGQQYGDQQLLSRAAYVYAELTKARTAPAPHGGWDRFADWDAVF